MAVFYDTHAHLDYPDFQADFAEVLRRARAAGISRMICIGTDVESSERAIKLAETHDEIFAAVGWHPSHANDAPADLRPPLKQLAAHPGLHRVRHVLDEVERSVLRAHDPEDRVAVRTARNRTRGQAPRGVHVPQAIDVEGLDQHPNLAIETTRRQTGHEFHVLIVVDLEEDRTHASGIVLERERLR